MCDHHPADVAAAEELIEALRTCAMPPTEDQLAWLFAAWRDLMRGPINIITEGK